jgi:hypothetical protein
VIDDDPRDLSGGPERDSASITGLRATMAQLVRVVVIVSYPSPVIDAGATAL